MLTLPGWAALFLAVTAIGSSWLYFRRYRLNRPLLGVVNLWDVLGVLTGVVCLPLLYLVLPAWLAAALLATGAASLWYSACEPVLPDKRVILPVIILVIAADSASAVAMPAGSWLPVLINDLVWLGAIIGAANLWAQGGLKARDAAILAGGLAVYDLIATSWLPLTGSLFARLAGLPFAPSLGWHSGSTSAYAMMGLGDVLLTSLFPLVMRKAYGRGAGLLAMLVGVAAIAGLLALSTWRLLTGTFPVMIVLGPLNVLQYALWRWRGSERTTWQYLLAEPLPSLENGGQS